MNKAEIKTHLYNICEIIIKDIIEPTCGYCGIQVDYWLSDIEMFTLNDEVLDETIMEKIQEKFNLSDTDMLGLDTWTSLIQIALYIYLEAERPQYPAIDE